jgi:hypothetical protein
MGYSDHTQTFFIQKLVAGAYQLGNTFDIRLPITQQILNRIIDCVPQAIANHYDQKLYKAFFLFTFSAFARIGELVCSSSNIQEVIQLSDVMFTKERGYVTKATVCFKRFKHNSAGPPKYETFSHGDCKISAIEALLTYLGSRCNKQGLLFMSQSGLPVSTKHCTHV